MWTVRLAAWPADGPHHPVALGVVAAAAGLEPVEAALVAAYGAVARPGQRGGPGAGARPVPGAGDAGPPRAPPCDETATRAVAYAGAAGARPAGGERAAAGHHRRAARDLGGASLCILTHIHAAGDSHLTASGEPHTTNRRAAAHPSGPAVDPHAPLPAGAPRALRIGIGGPVGSGKTALVAALCHTLAGELNMAVVTNDIYTTEDADFLLRNAVMPPERVRAVETGCCPHTAIRDDIAANLDAVEDARGVAGSARPGAGRERRRQPDRDVQPRTGRPPDLRRRRGRRRQGAPQGRARRHAAPTCWSSTRPTSPRWSGPTSA